MEDIYNKLVLKCKTNEEKDEIDDLLLSIQCFLRQKDIDIKK